MKVYCLSEDPNKPCFVIKLKSVTIMLDCGLSAHSVLNFLPLYPIPDWKPNKAAAWIPKNFSDPQIEGELNECMTNQVLVNSAPEFMTPLTKLVDFADIDVILVSNYMTMLALPFITENTGFKGVVYMTEPTLHIGKLFLEELVDFVEQSPKPNVAKYWKEILHLLPPPLCNSFKPHTWKQLYSLAQVNSSLTRVQMISYDQKIEITGALTVTAVSSGYCLGSSNWVIYLESKKLVYVSNTSTLTTHPRPMDQVNLKNADLMLLSSLTQAPAANPDSMLGELCLSVAVTLRNNGSVLIPCYPSGVVYDLFECLSSHLDSTALGQIPMYFISPVAHSSLEYSNILAEWLSQSKQNKVYFPEEPFPHAQLVKSGRLKHFKHVYTDDLWNDLRQPCVVFCGHPSLRFGDVVHFVEYWGTNPQNTIIFTEPEFPYLEALAPFQPLSMKAMHCPIDTSMNFTQANKMIKDLKPAVLILPERYAIPPVGFGHKNEFVIDQIDRKVLTIKRGEVISEKLDIKTVNVPFTTEMVVSVTLNELQSGLKASKFTAVLDTKDNKYKLDILRDDLLANKTIEPYLLETLFKKTYEWGQLDIDRFLRALTNEGVSDPKIEHNAHGYTIHLKSEDTLIQVDDKSTHIFCEKMDKNWRLKLRSIVMECLNSF
uniref:Integrator complex subunit 9 n=2 Tax=Schizaphis graminum TaxID=13262 RepID=A0A2S2P0Y1_SCHGA